MTETKDHKTRRLEDWRYLAWFYKGPDTDFMWHVTIDHEDRCKESCRPMEVSAEVSRRIGGAAPTTTIIVEVHFSGKRRLAAALAESRARLSSLMDANSDAMAAGDLPQFDTLCAYVREDLGTEDVWPNTYQYTMETD